MNFKKLYANTHPFHIFIAIWNLSCLFSLVLVFCFKSELVDYLAAYAFISGAIGNLVAVIVTLALAIRCVIRITFRKTAEITSEDWLGLFNGAFVIFFWFCLIGLMQLSGRFNK